MTLHKLIVAAALIFGTAFAVDAARASTGSCWRQLRAYENLSELDADLVILLDEGDSASDALYENELVQRLAPIADGRMLRMKDNAFIMATSAPSVLGLSWALQRLVPELATTLA